MTDISLWSAECESSCTKMALIVHHTSLLLHLQLWRGWRGASSETPPSLLGMCSCCYMQIVFLFVDTLVIHEATGFLFLSISSKHFSSVKINMYILLRHCMHASCKNVAKSATCNITKTVGCKSKTDTLQWRILLFTCYHSSILDKIGCAKKKKEITERKLEGGW